MVKTVFVGLILLAALLHCMVAFDLSHIQAEQPIPIHPLSTQEYELAAAQMRNRFSPLHKQGHKCATEEMFHHSHESHSHMLETPGACPLQSECDIPAIRDQYTAVGNTRMLHVEFLIEKDSELYEYTDIVPEKNKR